MACIRLAEMTYEVWSDVPKTTCGIRHTEVTLCFTVSATGWHCAVALIHVFESKIILSSVVVGLDSCRLSSFTGLGGSPPQTYDVILSYVKL